MHDSHKIVKHLLASKQMPARIPFFDTIWPDTLESWVKQGYPVDKNNQPIEPFLHFGFDIAPMIGFFDWHPKIGYEKIEQETDEWKIVRNGSGAALRYWKNKSGTPEHIDFKMTTRDIWEKEYKPLIPGSANKRIEPIINNSREKFRRYRAENLFVCFGHQFIWESMRCSMGDICLYETLLLDPDWVHDYARTYTDLHKQCYEILFEEVGIPDCVWMFEDLGYKNSLFCSPKIYEKLIFPYFAEMVEFFHNKNLPVILHTCGFVEPVIDLIVKTGFDGLNPMEVKAGNDPLRIAEKTGGNLALIGGMSVVTLESGDRELIRKETVNLIEGMKQRSTRFVFTSDHSISTNVKYEDFKYVLDIYREHMII